MKNDFIKNPKTQEEIDFNTGLVYNMLNNPVDRQTLENGIKEYSDSKTRQAAEGDLQKEILATVSDKTGIDKATIRKLGNMYFKQNYNQVQSEFETLESLYEELFGTDE